MLSEREMPLKPCPFCGGDAGIGTITYSHPYRNEEGAEQSVFYCATCCWCSSNNRGLIGHRTPELAANHWNGRLWPPDEEIRKKAKALLAAVCADGGEERFISDGYDAHEQIVEGIVTLVWTLRHQHAGVRG